MKNIYLAVFIALMMLACSNKSKLALPKYDENLPVLEKLQFLSSTTAVAFEWKSMYTKPIKGYKVYKAKDKDQPLELIATINDKYKTHFVDTKLLPNTKYYYVFKTFNSFDQEAKRGANIEIKTKNRMEAIPFVQTITGLTNMVKIIWRPHPNPSVKSYEIQRSKAKEDSFKPVATIQNRLSAEYIDLDLKPNESFKYKIYAISFEGIKSQPSAVVQSTTRSLPPAIKHLKVSQGQANKIILSWDSLPYDNFAYFNIYSRSSSYMPSSLLAKSIKNTYTDHISSVATSREYAVAMVDKDGLLSPLSAFVSGSTASLPKPPVLISCVGEQKGVKIEWIKSDDRAVKYILKRYGNGPDVEYKDLSTTSYLDSKADPKKVYKYEVIAVDKDGLKSDESDPMKSSVLK